MDEELDYLVGTQLEANPWSFSEIVREAFLREHDCVQRQDIAEVLGVDKSRVSQILGNPKTLKAASIQSLLDCLSSQTNRQNIISAWVRECFDQELAGGATDQVGSKISEKTIRRIDRQIRESRLSSAAKLSLEAFRKTEDPILRERLLDRAFFARQRLNEPGQAIGIARAICRGAVRRNEPLRALAGHIMRIRVLRSLPEFGPSEIMPLLDGVEMSLSLQGGADFSNSKSYLLATKATLTSEKVACRVAFCERGQLKLDDPELRSIRESCLERARRAKSYQERSRQYQQASRVSLLLDETFQAIELLEESFKAGGSKILDAHEVAGILHARILAKTESDKEASSYLRKAISIYARTLNLHHRQIAEVDLARLESRQFPEFPAI